MKALKFDVNTAALASAILKAAEAAKAADASPNSEQLYAQLIAQAAHEIGQAVTLVVIE